VWNAGNQTQRSIRDLKAVVLFSTPRTSYPNIGDAPSNCIAAGSKYNKKPDSQCWTLYSPTEYIPDEHKNFHWQFTKRAQIEISRFEFMEADFILPRPFSSRQEPDYRHVGMMALQKTQTANGWRRHLLLAGELNIYRIDVARATTSLELDENAAIKVASISAKTGLFGLVGKPYDVQILTSQVLINVDTALQLPCGALMADTSQGFSNWNAADGLHIATAKALLGNVVWKMRALKWKQAPGQSTTALMGRHTLCATPVQRVGDEQCCSNAATEGSSFELSQWMKGNIFPFPSSSVASVVNQSSPVPGEIVCEPGELCHSVQPQLQWLSSDVVSSVWRPRLRASLTTRLSTKSVQGHVDGTAADATLDQSMITEGTIIPHRPQPKITVCQTKNSTTAYVLDFWVKSETEFRKYKHAPIRETWNLPLLSVREVDLSSWSVKTQQIYATGPAQVLSGDGICNSDTARLLMVAGYEFVEELWDFDLRSKQRTVYKLTADYPDDLHYWQLKRTVFSAMYTQGQTALVTMNKAGTHLLQVNVDACTTADGCRLRRLAPLGFPAGSALIHMTADARDKQNPNADPVGEESTRLYLAVILPHLGKPEPGLSGSAHILVQMDITGMCSQNPCQESHHISANISAVIIEGKISAELKNKIDPNSHALPGIQFADCNYACKKLKALDDTPSHITTPFGMRIANPNPITVNHRDFTSQIDHLKSTSVEDFVKNNRTGGPMIECDSYVYGHNLITSPFREVLAANEQMLGESRKPLFVVHRKFYAGKISRMLLFSNDIKGVYTLRYLQNIDSSLHDLDGPRYIKRDGFTGDVDTNAPQMHEILELKKQFLQELPPTTHRVLGMLALPTQAVLITTVLNGGGEMHSLDLSLSIPCGAVLASMHAALQAWSAHQSHLHVANTTVDLDGQAWVATAIKYNHTMGDTVISKQLVCSYPTYRASDEDCCTMSQNTNSTPASKQWLLATS
jgi:hypothetical protein